MSDTISELGAVALLELGLLDTQGQELTPGMEAVIELMGLAGEAGLAREKLDLAAPMLRKRTALGREWRLCGIVASALGADYVNVTVAGQGLPVGFWGRVDDALFSADVEMSRPGIQKFMASSPLRWQRVILLAAVFSNE